MTIRAAIRLFHVLIVTILFTGTALAETKTKILKYDKDGKVIGFQEQDVNSSKKRAKTGKAGRSGAGEDDDPANQFEAGEVLVLNPPRGFSSQVGSMGFRVLENLNIRELGIEIYRLQTPTAMSVPEAIKTLRGRFTNLQVDANHHFTPSVANVEHPDKLARTLFRWNKLPATCGKGLKIGIVDSGVDLSHPALEGQNIAYRAFNQKSRKPGNKDHGTAIAGILVGKPEWGGLLPGASLYAANFMEYNESGRMVGSAMGLMKSAKWLIGKKVDIMNISITGTDNKVLRKLIEKATKKRLILVAAAGSSGKKNRPAYPAAYKGVVAVTALDMKGKIFYKSNTGSYIDFAAPGVKVYTPVPGGGRLQSGTSLAAPFVTALMGIEILNGRAKTVTQLNSLLRKGTKDLGKPGRDEIYGWGFAWQKPEC